MSTFLKDKYNIHGPLYTSYPTVLYCQESDLKEKDGKDNLLRSFDEINRKERISIYIQLPTCGYLCTFCACHNHITKSHNVEEPYIETLLKEWQL